jgi:ABC-type sugar transport system ATPase subunit
MADTPLLSVRGLRKRYGGVLAVDNMNLVVRHGDVHAVVGENGAGKSTLMKALAGVVRPDAGEIEFDGVPTVISSPGVARQHGVGIVYQELSLFPQRSVLANLFVNREPLRNGLVSVRAMEETSAHLLDRLGLRFDVYLPVSRLSIGEQQLVELARVLLEEPRLLILDEPNSALNERETRRLFDVLRQLNRRGITILYVSHRLEEVFSVCNRVTVTRKGRDVLTKDRADLTIPEVIEGMIGAPPTALFPPHFRAARFAGIPIALVRLQTLVLMGAICGLSGALYVGFRGAIDPQEGADFALIVIAAVIIGGTPLSGGWGTVIGAVVGMLIIQVISSGIIFFGIDATWSTFVTGAVTVLAVALDQIVKRQRDRALPS